MAGDENRRKRMIILKHRCFKRFPHVCNEKVRSSSLLGSTSLRLNAVKAKAAAPNPAEREQAGNTAKISSCEIPMQPRHFEAVIFSTKAAVATVAAALCHKFFHLPGQPWVAAVSAVIVTQPDLHASFKASFMRVIANLAGVLVGATLLVITGQPLVAMALGVLLTGLICYN